MELTLAIKHIYPTLTDNDFMVLDNNQWEWPYIKWYSQTITQPTQAELETAWTEVVALQNAEEIKKAKREAILNVLSETDQMNMLADVLDTVTSPTPDQTIIDNAKAKFAEIKTILNS